MATPSFKIERVAVIGAGISGVSSAAHLLRQGISSVVLFERSPCPSGVWHLDERVAPDPPYPNLTPSHGDYEGLPPTKIEDLKLTPPRTPSPERRTRAEVGSLENDDVDEDFATKSIAFAPPGPAYVGLRTNTVLRTMETSLAAWPKGLPDTNTERADVERYIQTVAETSGVNKIALYNTRVEEVRKDGGEWIVRTNTLHRRGRIEERIWRFDAVVVASGHYNMPRIPDIPGLKEWKARYPDRVQHSKSYRSPVGLRDKRVLIIGCGASALDIAKETASVAGQVYQSSRGGAMSHPPEMLPENALRIGGVKAFHLEGDDEVDGAIAGYVELNNGSKIRDIDHYHADDTPIDIADESVIVTADGYMMHNLHKDIFYQAEPTLAFVGVPYHVNTFSFFDFQAQAVARVFSGKAILPSRDAMRQEYQERLVENAPGRDFHSLRQEGGEIAYVRNLVDWMNRDAFVLGAEPMKGHSEEFLEAHEQLMSMLRSMGLAHFFRKDIPGRTFDHVYV
ncbi:Thiol-specific monooxygenase [Cyphellophora attinorum]|uniref:Thiol-specific monooxygenase n=1 Tax=Cyphellophora attinorum TaxID=1664694 RepID=A0A0N1H8M0_9EURO|nr:Thiol-specific monooxygenase [Phialophora attinorum]KPI39724.1 Thiol-specific monooxygenase [Phialophora attinorum]